MRTEEFAPLHALEERFWWFVGMRAIVAAILDPVLRAEAGHPPRRILDLGCGTGYMLDWLARYAGGSPVVGLDLARVGLDFCRERGHQALVQASAASLPFASARFDLVTSFEVLDEMPDDRPAFAEIWRVLEPGGCFLLRLAAHEWLRSRHDAAMHTARRTTLPEARRKLEQAGFVIERATYANTLLLPVVAAVRLGRRWLSRSSSGDSDVRPLGKSMRWIEPILLRCLHAEARFLRRPGAALPTGVSVILLARKPGS